MQTQIKIHDYNFDSATANQGWAQIEIFGQTVEFNFSCYDAVTAAIDLGYIEQPDDRDQNDIGYENPAFSATVRELLASDCRVVYQKNSTVLSDFYATEYGEQIVTRLALQSSEVREVIQAEAHRIALTECPIGMVDAIDLKKWFEVFHKEISSTGAAVNYVEISEYMKQSYYAAEQETLSQL